MVEAKGDEESERASEKKARQDISIDLLDLFVEIN